MSDWTELESEAVRITRELIRIDTSNFGDGSGPTERPAADYVVGLLREVGLDPVLFESAPGRASVVVRIAGADSQRGGLVVHGHLDVVPANASDWSVDPFSADERDDMIWGRGAVDMKSMDGMMLANLRRMARENIVPPRDLVFAFFADEEQGGRMGSEWMVTNHPELFDGCAEAISEVGGYSITLPVAGSDEKRRAYLLQTAEKGYAWVHLRALGRAGHGSLPNDENAIVRLAEAITRIDQHEWPIEYVASVQALFDEVHEITGASPRDDLEGFLDLMGGGRAFVAGTLRDSANFTRLDAGYKNNVIPGEATAHIDCRFLPGHQDELLDTIRSLAGPQIELIVDQLGISLDAPRESEFVDKMHQAILAEDPGAELLPYCLSAGTDNKWLNTLGIQGYGFVPLQLPEDLNFALLFHGVDERVPVDAVKFGARVLRQLLEDC
ncbi:M20/M25/M40 family metallo-hydrolase [Propionimicrobium sp. PCR01-08-3]|uniref:M20/M25/M40 family metallo-hydrolase n=1 Tax=Propionimicrobium sp. PCR01-08-3 TaxID=3052086 RepID=UPI00255CD69D|nr:M20/M25/M40 family metallo-hydrolase [Propionimicrobium sp. PCR01-08-3]WIY84103.1 M20/M25/M40 family metallo-hydrolase [Propionimicrobium sp. PCR01-08-3]